MRIAYLGLGAMGAPMAATLAAAGPVRVWNRTGSVARDHAAAHGSVAVAELLDLADADVICTCLPTDVEVAAIATVLGPVLAAGTVWLDHTSGAPAGARDVAAQLAAHGVTYLDAPVSGGTDGAARGALTVMVGGDAEALASVRAVLDIVGDRTVHVGDVGAGMAVKAVNNALLATALWAASEGLSALAAQGVDPVAALEVISTSSGRSFATERLIPERVLPGTFPRTFALALLAKDVSLARGVLDDVELAAPLLHLVDQLTAAASSELGPDADHAELVRIVERAAGVELRAHGMPTTGD